ncbi:MAG: ribosome small subunit-dependent GTPase A [Burkholderiaceae bacterium]|nr:ribosome small subunit-dependent GTPase A [Burkholderiaceae bacterium]
MADAALLHKGLVVASHGRHVLVERDDGSRLICHPRGKKTQAVVGDRVLWQATQDEGTLEKIEPRRNLFYRQDEVRTKAFAANLDQVLILIAAEPEFSENQLSRALIAAEAEHITPVIALNKSDLGEPFARAWARMAVYRDMGYQVLPLALKPAGSGGTAAAESAQALGGLLRDKTTLVLGPSGSGKSTLTNLLVPAALAATQEISRSLHTGKHTTTSTTWYWVDAQRHTALIDSPGFQEFGLNHVDPMQLAAYMPDLRPHVANCKFYNCTHLHEPGCGVIPMVTPLGEAGTVSEQRYRIYSALFEELSRSRY